MQPTHTELLEVALAHDAKIRDGHVRVNKAVESAGKIDVTPGIPANELVLVAEDDDPFNGNRNNRRVAARIAAEKRRIYLNNSDPTHTGDPNKAEKDLAQSFKVNPDPVELTDDTPVPLPHIELTPGSPAALREAAKKPAGKPAGKPAAAETPGGPPVWKPNA